MKLIRISILLFLLIIFNPEIGTRSIVSLRFVGAQNLVPNHSFEYTNSFTWNIEGVDDCLYFWNNPNESTADYFHKKATNFKYQVPKNYYGIQYPKTGDAYAGICIDKQHMEYLQTELTDILVKDHEYCVEMYISRADYSKYSVDQLGVFFSNRYLQEWGTSSINFKPQVIFIDSNAFYNTDEWFHLCQTYIAQGSERHITMGYFGAKHFDNTHYYIDDISVKLISDTTSCLCKEHKDIFKRKDTLKVGKCYLLRNVHFVFDRYDLTPDAIKALSKLLTLLKEYPKIKIEIRGHTDFLGTDEYNLKLSQERAKSIADYFISKGIEAERVKYRGFGRSKPLASNDSEEDREKNRRVEFVILSR